ncbi:sigma-70 family RNA polymerase sigma factor [Anaerosalibacter bizertensis]|uniref:Sigma-70 family RNA polymerase sigma factor n=1 Tax=Anaerosalibacter bizertensis TaxID=932217 RepID=A0A9Q4ACW6_9FIRM|nr:MULTISPECIES: sigma-70 family RNA polymerase sigma factor [Bacillota]MBV1820790.1 sigma-70 family RNA polymerase sigma factor [Bacteroidales bacterium MSK.15.36]MCB5559119.1 sigma-70 family RNA polymerase sigma factor [Anaerosalibacter bizertensis]MCG4565094.1 sigma-70 family RNA polymerase sigma factor [Anaerosalibacter bizertensis]MCG4580318.1 sigma-70 family RNA polymerase sigma factor [Clostridium cochlearium]MCG4581874.1 sigma-70 family RNA polymerase sigma factor [Anaerosalibacter biz
MKENKKNYYIFLGDTKVDVSEEVYKGYWQETNRENYLNRLDKENKLGYFSEFVSYGTDRSMEERLIDKAVDVEKLVAVKMQIEALNKALDKLSPEEREIIQALFFDEIPQRELAKTLNISQGAVFRRKEKTLEKLKVFLED